MPRTILCQKCGVILNLPDRITAGKRVKCPKCGERFTLTEKDASSASTLPGEADVALASSRDYGRRPPSHDDLPTFVVDRDLRDVFELPTGTGAQIEHSAVAEPKRKISDAEALFAEDSARRKKLSGAEARARARRCMTCGGVVGAGMSICPSCGVDQETGMRIDLDEDLAPPPPPRPSGPPIHIAMTGFMTGLAGIIFLVAALALSVRSEPGLVQYGWLCLALVAAFGIYGAIQFFIGRSTRYLMLALTLGVVVDIVALLVLPSFQAFFPDQNVVVRHERPKDDPDALDEEDITIANPKDLMDLNKLEAGVTGVVIYALLSIYLMSPPVKRHFARQAAFRNAALF